MKQERPKALGRTTSLPHSKQSMRSPTSVVEVHVTEDKNHDADDERYTQLLDTKLTISFSDDPSVSRLLTPRGVKHRQKASNTSHGESMRRLSGAFVFIVENDNGTI